MVCLVAPLSNKKEIEDKKVNNFEMDEDLTYIDVDEIDDDEYKVVGLTAGSLIEHTPLFTPDGKYLLIIYRSKVLLYSTTTGEWVKDVEEFGENDLIAIEFSLNNPGTLIGCSLKGEVIFWELEKGKINNRVKLPVYGNTLKTFTLLKMKCGQCALVTYKYQDNMKYDIINIEKNVIINCPLELQLTCNDNVITVAETNFFHYFVIAQKQNLLVVDYKTWRYRLWKNAKKVEITVVKVHPSEMLFATGDKVGKIFLYRNLFKSGVECHSCLYHWHHTPVTSIAFTLSGSGFYSGGCEAVLVKWNIKDPATKDFLPRLPGQICHIAVGDRNRKVAVCASDNSIQILDDQNRQKCVLQNFTFVDNKIRMKDRFPVGLLLNPTNNSLVLNGRSGHLQFYSTYTKSLLYNIDIVMQNELSRERNKILYDIEVINADFNINWMVTGELWDDQQHLSELRLKFWKFESEKQTYSLNTCIELPHEGGIKMIKFSSPHSADNLLCATLGNDEYIKIWRLEDSDNIYHKAKHWFCIAKTNYKNFKASSMDFSVDGSLLAVGYGNTLCIFKSNTLKLKAALTSPPIFDGSLQKIQIIRNENKPESLITMGESQKKLLDLFRNFEENIADYGIVKLLKNSSPKTKTKISTSSVQNKNSEILFKKILGIPELNLFQKLLIYQKLNIRFSVTSTTHLKLIEYLSTKFCRETREKHLRNYSNVVNTREKFKAKYKLRKYYSRQNMYQNKVNETLAPLLDLLKIEDLKNDVEMKTDKLDCNGFADDSVTNCEDQVKRKKVNELKKSDHIPFNLQSISGIKSVNFGKGEFTHLVIIVTEYRVIIWNILTLRIQFVLKLSVRHIAIDNLTSLCAALTANNELYVFLPNALLFVYHRYSMPGILNMCWVPRKYPKSSSINLDWQSFSTLYFLTDKQELIYLSSKKDDDDVKDSISFINGPSKITTNSIYNVNSLKRMNSKSREKNDSNRESIGIPGKAEIRSIIQMAPHASAPINLLCNNFIKSLLSTNEGQIETVKEVNVETSTMTDSDTDDETGKIYLKIKERKKDFNQFMNSSNTVEKIRNYEKLQKVLYEVLPDSIEF